MTEVVLFHHARGLTGGVRDFAVRLRAAGHEVTLPDLFDGITFETLDEGVAHAEQIGLDALLERGRIAAAELPEAMVYVGFSLGVLPAQMLAQTRPGAKGAVLVSACVPPSRFDGPWPEDVPVQIHAMRDDRLLIADGDLEVASELAAHVESAELFLYPGDRHLFMDSSLDDFDPDAAAQLRERVLDLLGRLGQEAQVLHSNLREGPQD
jgi:dienelactone hydrolase